MSKPKIPSRISVPVTPKLFRFIEAHANRSKRSIGSEAAQMLDVQRQTVILKATLQAKSYDAARPPASKLPFLGI